MAPPPARSAVVAFERFELDAALYQLRRDGGVVRLEPKVFDVLAYLVARRERVVGKDELLDALWPGEHVSESVLPRCIAAVRRALDDAAEAPRFVQTVHGRGYRFVGAVHDACGAAPPRGEAPFVGREPVMATCTRALADAAGGTPRVLLVAGEPGVGKTRLVEELAAVARRDGFAVLAGRSLESDGAPAFWPWTQALRALSPAAAAFDGDGVREVPLLAPARIGDAAAPDLRPEQARFRVFDAVARTLAHEAVERPLVVALDDLHWADASSLLLLRFVASALDDARMLVVGTYRDVAVRRHHPLAGVLGDLARDARCERVVLRGLDRAAVARFLELATGTPPADVVTAAVHERTGGNPFFVGELVRLCLADGEARIDEHAVRTLPLPHGVREAIGRRLEALTPACDAMLGAAAVLGHEFAVGILARVADVPGEQLLALLDEAIAAGVVQRVPATSSRYAFVHALVRETRYDELGTAERVRLHRRAGVVLEAACGDDPRHVLEIAHHCFEGAPGADDGRALAWQRRAAAQALASLAWEDAAACYERALQLLDAEPGDAAERAGLLLGLGEARALAGERQRARAAFERAAEVARRAGRADLLGRAALGFAGRAEMGMPRDDAVLALLEEARDAVGDRHRGVRARVLARLSGTAPHGYDLATRTALSAESVALARRDADPATLAAALSARYWALLGPDHVDERLALAGEMLEVSVRARDRHVGWIGHEIRLGALLALGDVGGADAAIDAMSTIAEELRLPVERWFVCWFRAARALADGRLADAERLIDAGRTLGERAEHPGTFFAAHGLGLVLAHERGHLCDFARGFEPLLAYYPWAERLRRVGAALSDTETGALDDARRAFETLAADDFRDFPRDEHWLLAMTLLASICTDVGDVARAGTLYALMAPFARRFAVHDLLRVSCGSVAHYLGNLATVMGRTAEAARHYEDALDANARAGSRPYLARTQYDYARLLSRRGGRGDAERAVALLGEAAAAGRDMGMPRIVEVAEGLRHEAAARQGSSRKHQAVVRTGKSVPR